MWCQCPVLKPHPSPCLCSLAEPAGREGGAADGVELPALGHPHERGQVPALRQGPPAELLRAGDVHCSAASAAVLCLQVTAAQPGHPPHQAAPGSAAARVQCPLRAQRLAVWQALAGQAGDGTAHSRAGGEGVVSMDSQSTNRA